MPPLYTCEQCRQPLNLEGFEGGSVVACPYCLRQITVPIAVTPVSYQPRARPKKKQDASSTLSAWVITLGLAASCGGCWMVAANRKPSAPSTPSIEVELMGLARQEVRERLKYPDNATFHTFDRTVVEIETGIWVVMGKVDAMNAFGAKPTLRYKCTFWLTKAKPRTWDLRELIVGDEIFVQR